MPRRRAGAARRPGARPAPRAARGTSVREPAPAHPLAPRRRPAGPRAPGRRPVAVGGSAARRAEAGERVGAAVPELGVGPRFRGTGRAGRHGGRCAREQHGGHDDRAIRSVACRSPFSVRCVDTPRRAPGHEPCPRPATGNPAWSGRRSPPVRRSAASACRPLPAPSCAVGALDLAHNALPSPRAAEEARTHCAASGTYEGTSC